MSWRCWQRPRCWWWLASVLRMQPARRAAPFVVDAAAPTPTVDPTVAGLAVLASPRSGFRAPFGVVRGGCARIPFDFGRVAHLRPGKRWCRAFPRARCCWPATWLPTAFTGLQTCTGFGATSWSTRAARTVLRPFGGAEVRVERSSDLPQDIFTDAGDPRLVIASAAGRSSPTRTAIASTETM